MIFLNKQNTNSNQQSELGILNILCRNIQEFYLALLELHFCLKNFKM